MEALHIRLEALTASYSYPFLKSGTQLTLPAPPFSSILGNLSACVGRAIGPEETLIAFEFQSSGRSLDLERTRRLQTHKKYGRLAENPQRGIARREFHIQPRLDIYITELSFQRFLYEPVACPCLGRSQDVAWIRFVRRVQLHPVESGQLGPTLVKFPNPQVGGLVLPPLVDFYRNDRRGYVREAGRYSRYQFVRFAKQVKANSDLALYHSSDSDSEAHVIVLHDLKA